MTKRHYGYQFRIALKLLPKAPWATFDTREAAYQYARQLVGLLAQGSAKYGLTEFLASVQGYMVVFGPALLAAIFLMMRWPNKKGEIQSDLNKAVRRN